MGIVPSRCGEEEAELESFPFTILAMGSNRKNGADTGGSEISVLRQMAGLSFRGLGVRKSR